MTRRHIPLDTYDRRTVRGAYRRSAGRRRVLVGIAMLCGVLVLVGFAVGTARSVIARRDVTAEKATPVAKRTTTASVEPSAPAKTAEPATQPTITIAAVGDMIFDRKVRSLIEAEGGQAPLARVASRLAAADVAVGNLESTIADSGTRNTAKDVTFRGHPRGIESLTLAGFDLLSMANNHVLDYGAQPLLDTVSALDAAGIGHAGAGANQTAAWTPAVVERDGVTIAYLAFSHIVPPGFIAQADRAGMASGRQDEALTLQAIRDAAAKYDHVLVSFHWGVEYMDNANATQVSWAHKAVDAGADMVLAHHPHVIQGLERYNGALIAYSLGDFVFDHYSRKTGEAFILEAELGPNGVGAASAIPVYLDGYGRPEFVTGAAARTILDRLVTISKPHGTTVVIDGDVAQVLP